MPQFYIATFHMPKHCNQKKVSVVHWTKKWKHKKWVGSLSGWDLLVKLKPSVCVQPIHWNIEYQILPEKCLILWHRYGRWLFLVLVLFFCIFGAFFLCFTFFVIYIFFFKIFYLQPKSTNIISCKTLKDL